jgi:hypothetical protein
MKQIAMKTARAAASRLMIIVPASIFLIVFFGVQGL